MSTTLNENLLLAVPLAPLAGSLIAGLFGKAVGRAGAHTVTILGVAISFILSAIVFFDVMNGARHIDPYTHLLNGTAPWPGICSSVTVAIVLFGASRWLIRSKDF